MEKNINWLRWPLEHYSISLLLIVLLFVLGIFGMYDMPKDEFPQFTIRQGVVVAVYPGATTEEVEQQVARELERYLFTYKEVNRTKTTTTSQNGMCYVMVRLNDEVNNKDEVWSKIKHGLAMFKQSLPSGVLALIANDDFGNTSALLIAIESGERSYRELHDYSDAISDRLAGKSKYTLPKMMRLALNGVTAFSARPLFAIYNIGILFLIIAFLIGVYVVYSLASGHVVQGWASLMLSVWLVGGFILISLGIIGTYIAQIYTEVKGRPLYHIQEILS